jgi:hypothetical protein
MTVINKTQSNLFMKKKLLLFMLIACSMATYAQQNPPRRPFMDRRMNQERLHGDKENRKEKLELYKVQFFTKELALTPAEAEMFWPVYEVYKKAAKEIIENKSNDEIQFQEAMLTLRKKYKNDLKPVLKSEDRINNALKIDREFLNKVRLEMMRRGGI